MTRHNQDLRKTSKWEPPIVCCQDQVLLLATARHMVGVEEEPKSLRMKVLLWQKHNVLLIFYKHCYSATVAFNNWTRHIPPQIAEKAQVVVVMMAERALLPRVGESGGGKPIPQGLFGSGGDHKII